MTEQGQKIKPKSLHLFSPVRSIENVAIGILFALMAALSISCQLAVYTEFICCIELRILSRSLSQSPKRNHKKK